MVLPSGFFASVRKVRLCDPLGTVWHVIVLSRPRLCPPKPMHRFRRLFVGMIVESDWHTDCFTDWQVDSLRSRKVSSMLKLGRWVWCIAALGVVGCGEGFEEAGVRDSEGVGDAIELKDRQSASRGTECAPGCVWSGFAVAIGAQPDSSSCTDGPCACVENGNVYVECAPDEPGDDANEIQPAIPNESGATDAVEASGRACADGCVWSSWAVSFGAQSAEAECDDGPCACVRNGNVFDRCAVASTGSGDSSSSEPEPRPEPPSASPSPTVPYFCQFENRITGWATCQNTSIAMILAQHGWNGVPDDITREFGRRRAQQPAGLSGVFNALAARAGLEGSVDAGYRWHDR